MQLAMKVGVERGTLSEGSNQRLSELRIGRRLAEGFELSLTCSDDCGLPSGRERASHEGSKSAEHLPAGLTSSASSESQ
ncbi:hypothetical protein [Streptomyces sp. KHY 26]|uniref:hypothetical protein n=1 Tax=Streptomyces sp. KHY 26 TaxID=3097359 RepID=UPI00376EBEFE